MHARLMDEIAEATGILLTERDYLAAQTFGDIVGAFQRAAGLLHRSSH